MHRATSLACLVAVAGISVLPLTARAQNIDTRNVNSAVYGGTGLFSQSFTVGSLTTLNSYSFWVGANDAAAPTNGVGAYQFFTQLFQLNGTTLVGGALYTSTIRNAVCCDNSVPPRVDFNVGSLALISGAQYLAVISRTTVGGLDVGYVTGPNSTFINSYAGGEFLQGFTGAGIPNPTTATYAPMAFAPGNDLMFVAQFAQTTSTVPEPSTFALFAVGMGAVALARRRRRI